MSTDLSVKPVILNLQGETGPETKASLKARSKAASAESKRVAGQSKAKEAADDLQRLLKNLNTELRLEVRKDSGDVVVKIVDPETRKVLKQIPSEEMERIRERMSVTAGVFLRTKS